MEKNVFSKELFKDAFIMDSEPYPDLTFEEAKKAVKEIETETDLAFLFAIVSDKAWWTADDEYNFPKGSKARKAAMRKNDLWFSLMDELCNRIFDILIKEGVTIPETKQIEVLEPFMQRNGFKNATGWWISK